jgi:predicted O-methyltransferase YrrM
MYIQMSILNNDFVGINYRLANNWFNIINVDDYNNKPINYLEIGAFYGANLISVANSYGLHIESKLYCIDPWEDYEDYSEYKTMQSTIYGTFLNNIKNANIENKLIINRGYSNIKINDYENDFFDIIYIDGNHEPEYVLEDAVVSFRKLKKNGIMIFDDYGWGGPELTQKGIDAFVAGYYKRIQFLGLIDSQYFIKKIK